MEWIDIIDGDAINAIICHSAWGSIPSYSLFLGQNLGNAAGFMQYHP
jgi:hypothetical protein